MVNKSVLKEASASNENPLQHKKEEVVDFVEYKIGVVPRDWDIEGTLFWMKLIKD